MSIDDSPLPAGLINQAVVIYVSPVHQGRPSRNRAAVLALIDGPVGARLLDVVEALNDDADTIDVRSEEAVDHSLLPAFAKKMRDMHPWLDDAAVEALGRASRYRRMLE